MTTEIPIARTPQGEMFLDIQRMDCTPWLEPDPGWRFTDINGHAHRWADDETQTFDVQYGESYIGDGGEEYRHSWWACKLCGERFNPGMRAPRERRLIQVDRSWHGWFVWENIGGCGDQVPLPPVFPGYSGKVILTRMDLDELTNRVRYEFVGQGELIQEERQ